MSIASRKVFERDSIGMELANCSIREFVNNKEGAAPQQWLKLRYFEFFGSSFVVCTRIFDVPSIPFSITKSLVGRDCRNRDLSRHTE